MKKKKNISNIKKYDEFCNEGFKNWLATAMLLVSLGVLPKTSLSDDNKSDDVKEYVDSLSSRDVDSLKIVEEIKSSGVEKIQDVHDLFEKLKVDTSFKNQDLLSFLKYINEKPMPIGANVLLIDVAIPFEVLHNVPLYGITLNPGGEYEINIKSGLAKDIYLDARISERLYVNFMTNPSFTSVGIKLNF